MSTRYQRRFGYEPQNAGSVGAAMTFLEIAEELGYVTPGASRTEQERGRKRVYMTYKNAMQKIRRQREAAEALAMLVAFRQQERGRRCPDALQAEDR